MATKDQQDMGSGDPKQRTGGFGTSGSRTTMSGGGEHGEKRPTNADHDQKIARNRERLLSEEEEQASRSHEHGRHSAGRAADDTLGQTEGRRNSPDPDRERKSGDIVSGSEHSQFPGNQAGYDARPDTQRPPEATDLGHLDKGRNDDLSRLDKDDVEPMK